MRWPRCAQGHGDGLRAKTGFRGNGRAQEVREYRTWTSALRELRAWLVAEGVTQVAMEATGVYWRAPWHVLEAETGFELLLCNAQHVKNLPGRKTDIADAAWLAQLLECGLLRGSFVPTPVMARLRDLGSSSCCLSVTRESSLDEGCDKPRSVYGRFAW